MAGFFQDVDRQMATNAANEFLEPFWARLQGYIRVRHNLAPAEAWKVSSEMAAWASLLGNLACLSELK